jgi:hypothetical protein
MYIYAIYLRDLFRFLPSRRNSDRSQTRYPYIIIKVTIFNPDCNFQLQTLAI